MKHRKTVEAAKTSTKEIQVEFEKGKFWALTLPGLLHQPANSGNERKLLVTLQQTQAEKLITCGMECNLIMGKENAIPGILEKVSIDNDTIRLEVTPTGVAQVRQ